MGGSGVQHRKHSRWHGVARRSMILLSGDGFSLAIHMASAKGDAYELSARLNDLHLSSQRVMVGSGDLSDAACLQVPHVFHEPRGKRSMNVLLDRKLNLAPQS